MKTSEKWYEVRKKGILLFGDTGKKEAMKYFNDRKNQTGIQLWVCSIVKDQLREKLFMEYL